MSIDNEKIEQLSNQINQITESLEGTIAQIDALNRNMKESSKNLTENLTAVNENMRLILQVIKKGRSNTQEEMQNIQKNIREEIQNVWEEKALKEITQDELKAIEKLGDINKALSDNLYMQQLLSIIASLRQIVSKSGKIQEKKKQKLITFQYFFN